MMTFGAIKENWRHRWIFWKKNREYVLVGGGAIKIDKNGKELLKYLLPEKMRISGKKF